jgi:hypothetical protein
MAHAETACPFPASAGRSPAAVGACGRALALALLCLCLGAEQGHGGENAYGEYEVKAAFLLNFARLVEWPSAAFEGEHTPLVLGLLGNDPFEGALQAVVEGRTAGTRPIEIRALASLEEIGRCHIVFVSNPEPAPLPRILVAAQGSNVLLVGDTEDFARQGGAISFYREDGRVRFAINRRAAELAGLRISSRMLKLAKLVPEGTSATPAPRYEHVAVDAVEPHRPAPPVSADPL